MSSPEEVIGRTRVRFFSPEGERDFKRDDDRVVIATGEPIVNHEEWSPDALGKRRWLSTTKVPVFNPETGATERLVCIRRDITQMKEAEDKLKAANAELSLTLSNLKKRTKSLGPFSFN